MLRGNFGDFREEPRSITGDVEDDDIEDETLTERLVGLTEMFPDPVRSVVCNAGYYGFEGSKKLFSASKQVIWILATSFSILAFPIMFEGERSQMEQSQLQHQRQILLGPNATSSSGAGHMQTPIPSRY